MTKLLGQFFCFSFIFSGFFLKFARGMWAERKMCEERRVFCLIICILFVYVRPWSMHLYVKSKFAEYGESKIWCKLDVFFICSCICTLFWFLRNSIFFVHNYFCMCALVCLCVCVFADFFAVIVCRRNKYKSWNDFLSPDILMMEWETVGELETCSHGRVKCIIIRVCLRFFFVNVQ